MTVKEFSDNFDIGLVSYLRFKKLDDKEYLDSIEINEYEKSLYLTKAQNEIVTELYSGRSVFGDSYEQTEELRRYLADLNDLDIISNFNTSGNTIAQNSVLCNIPETLLFITHESCKVILNDRYCNNKEIDIECIPITRDEYNIIKNNPFKNNKIWRIDHSNNRIELISKHDILEYKISYLKTPRPIILEDISPYTVSGVSDITECQLHPILHEHILERAIQNSLRDIAKQQPQEEQEQKQ